MIQSIRAFPVGQPGAYPIIGLRSGETIEFHFDRMTTDQDTYNFGVIHCNHDWIPSDLDAHEYLQGFQFQRIEESEVSFSTLNEYVHYTFTYPTDISQPRYSGNYAMIVFEGSDIQDRSSWLISFRFVVYETALPVAVNITNSSVVAERFTHQEVNFQVGYKDFTINDPMNDIHVTVIQNMDWQRAHTGIKPIFVKPDVMEFYNARGDQAFEAGNEWRNFEMKALNFASSEVEMIRREEDGYHVYLRQDIPEGKRAYATWPDLNGSYIIHSDMASDSETESEYVNVHFTLTMNEIPEAQILLDGKFLEYSAPVKLTYDTSIRAYHCTLLLKQGYYNYRYLIRDYYNPLGEIKFTEGSHTATENIYHVIVYMYDRNLECDRIVGIQAKQSAR